MSLIGRDGALVSMNKKLGEALYHIIGGALAVAEEMRGNASAWNADASITYDLLHTDLVKVQIRLAKLLGKEWRID